MRAAEVGLVGGSIRVTMRLSLMDVQVLLARLAGL